MSDQPPTRPTSRSRILQVFNVVASVGILVMMLHVLANVAMRYLFNSPLAGTLEIVSYWYLPIVAYLGFVLTKHAGQNIDAPLIFDRLTWGNRRIVVLLGSLIGVIVCGLFAFYTLTELALHGLETGATGGVSDIPIWPVYFLLPAVFLILALMFLRDSIRAAKGDIGESDEATTEAMTEVGPGAGLDPDLEVRR